VGWTRDEDQPPERWVKEAEEMVNKAIARDPALNTCEEILNEVYKQKGRKE